MGGSHNCTESKIIFLIVIIFPDTVTSVAEQPPSPRDNTMSEQCFPIMPHVYTNLKLPIISDTCQQKTKMCKLLYKLIIEIKYSLPVDSLLNYLRDPICFHCEKIKALGLLNFRTIQSWKTDPDTKQA